MRRTTLLTAIACGLMLTNCSGSDSGSSSVQSNKYLGSLPTIYADYQLSESRLNQELNEEGSKVSKGDMTKMISLMTEYEKKLNAAQAKYKSNKASELDRIQGQEIPFKYSDALVDSNLYYSIEGPVTIIADHENVSFIVKLVIAEDFTVPRMKGYDYMVYAKCINSEGTPIAAYVTIPITPSTEAQSFEKGASLQEWKISPTLYQNPKYWSNFAELVFCTKNEYETAKEAYDAQRQEAEVE